MPKLGMEMLSGVFSSDRRDFLRHGVVGLAGAASLVAASTNSAEEKNVGSGKDPKNFIDAHVHVWTNDFGKYPLAKGFTPQDMKPAVFLPEDILRHAKPSGVNRIVLVQMSYYGFDNSYMLDVICRSPKVFRGVAVVDWKGSTPDAKMCDLGKKGVRGFRIFPQNEPPEKCLEGEGLDKMFRYGASARLAMCLLVNPEALEAVEKRCKKFPDTPVIIDHLGRIGMGGLIKESDVQNLCALAQYPQVKVKVSGFYALGKGKAPHVDLAPLIKRVYEAFGPERLMWGSDCPFQVANETYEDSVSLIRDRLDFLSNKDREWMLCRTAEECFFQ